MQEFLTVVFGYPTLPYSVVLSVALVYWGLAAFGLVDDGFGDLGADGALDGGTDLHGLSALLQRFGLGGVPVMVVVTLLALFGWVLTYFVHLYLLLPLPDLLRWSIGTGVALLAPLPAVPLTALLLRPIRRFLLRLRPVPQASLLGRVGVVASPRVDARNGHATVDDGGAGLVLQVRSDIELQRGERIVLVEHVAEQHYYRVVRADAVALDFQDNLLPGNKENHP
ncbi:DUF1449 family protein [Stenotrophomonas sp. S48]|uniref:OB-fold-containig protein n=1 Tax=unclassified Stenotrophomonas TaxID=196198 RepID=UPI00190143F2|nr:MULTISPECIES: OB-fold-containig protein [unclassified Stenotrophomonas]MBK0028042.1 DUF1449 family protein [Stenotrophomonas sp. S48]MBK0050153.1 DUF1449 family protein [Stenotrophomonas sp. S49]